MLSEITIENLGVIPRATAEFSPGLTVVTGETGAGKTMVVTSLRLLAGARSDSSRIRQGAAKAIVEGLVDVEAAEEGARAAALDAVDEAGGTVDSGEVVVSREVSAQGRSKARLGGRLVPAAALARFTEPLVAIHGQNDQLRLLSAEQQLAALDRFGADIPPLAESYRKAFREYSALARDLKRRTAKRRELAQEVDRLDYAIAEIDEVDPQPGELESLSETIKRLQSVDGLREAVTTAVAAIDGAGALEEFAGAEDAEGAADLLGRAQSALQGTEDSEIDGIAARLSELTAALTGISGELGQVLSQLPTDPEALEGALQRQSQLKSLTRKYAPDIDGVIEWRRKAERRRSPIDISPEAIEELERRLAEAKERVESRGVSLREARREAASRLEAEVTEELHGLAMPKASIVVAMRESKPTIDGLDEVELELKATGGARPAPLAQAASGGELSRVMLAVEVVLAKTSSGATLVFDEIDAGVGGRAAGEIGRRLAQLAEHNQVIVVTHLPQVAAFGDRHLVVTKEVTDESVTSGVRALDGEERVSELARMLAGLDDTETGRAHARELLERARADAAPRASTTAAAG